jgi:hypothetical protein
MAKQPDFDLKAAHRYFSAHCFNAAWDLIDKKDRTPEEDQRMVSLNHASMYHWSQREDCTDKNRSIGYWQAARIHALLGLFHGARYYGGLCLSYSHDLEPFYLGYAYEALARAEMVAGNRDAAQEHLAKATILAEKVGNKDEKKALRDDLATITG